MDKTIEENKLIEYCAELDIEAVINWQQQPVSLHLQTIEEQPRLFGPGESGWESGEAWRRIRGGKIVCCFRQLEIGLVELARIGKLFSAAYMRYLEDFYLCNSGK